MNKAEEQYRYNQGRIMAQADIMDAIYSDKASTNITAGIKSYCCVEKTMYRDKLHPIAKGRLDYINTIIHAIDFGAIKDWPSFVEYMTGEDYVEEKPICETCEGSGEVSAPHYSLKGEIADCDFITCPKCGGKDE